MKCPRLHNGRWLYYYPKDRMAQHGSITGLMRAMQAQQPGDHIKHFSEEFDRGCGS
jgi:hypothetical protein